MSFAKKILCALDLSEPSRAAMIEAADLAKCFQAQLTLLHVQPNPLSVTGDVIASLPSCSSRRGATSSTSSKNGEFMRRSSHLRPFEAKLLIDHNPASEIVRFARDGHFDLIVVATHGRTGIKHLMLGSVAERVVREAPCKVLVARRVVSGHQ